MKASTRVINTFFKLLQHTSYQQLTVSQITQAAGITRTYFYQLFDNKRDLAQQALFSIVRQLLAAFASSFSQADKRHLDYQSIAQGITLIRQHQTELASLLKSDTSLLDLRHDFRQQLAQTVTDALRVRFTINERTDYAVQVFIAATMATIQWTISHPTVTVSQIASMVDRFTGEGMLAALMD